MSKDDLEIIEYDDEEDSIIKFSEKEDGDSDVPKRGRTNKNSKKRKFNKKNKEKILIKENLIEKEKSQKYFIH